MCRPLSKFQCGIHHRSAHYSAACDRTVTQHWLIGGPASHTLAQQSTNARLICQLWIADDNLDLEGPMWSSCWAAQHNVRSILSPYRLHRSSKIHQGHQANLAMSTFTPAAVWNPKKHLHFYSIKYEIAKMILVRRRITRNGLAEWISQNVPAWLCMASVFRPWLAVPPFTPELLTRSLYPVSGLK